MARESNAIKQGQVIYHVTYYDEETNQLRVEDFDDTEHAVGWAETLLQDGITGRKANYAHIYKSEYIDTIEKQVDVNLKRRHNKL